MPIAEVETPYYARPAGSASKLNTWRDGFRILRMILRLYQLQRPLSFFSWIAGGAGRGRDRLAIPVVDHVHRDRPGAAFADGDLVDRPDAARLAGAHLRPDPGQRHPGRQEMKRLFYLGIEGIRREPLGRLAGPFGERSAMKDPHPRRRHGPRAESDRRALPPARMVGAGADRGPGVRPPRRMTPSSPPAPTRSPPTPTRVVPFHIGEERFRKDGRVLADRAGRIARRSRQRGAAQGDTVAGSLPPLFGSYRPDLFIEKEAQGIAETADRRPHTPCRCLACRDPRLDRRSRVACARRSATTSARSGSPSPWRTARTPRRRRSCARESRSKRRQGGARLEGGSPALQLQPARGDGGGPRRRAQGAGRQQQADARRLCQRLPAAGREGIWKPTSA